MATRIISGFARGVNIDVPDGLEVRPTLEKIRGAIFSAVGDVSGWRVVDLYAGSGALGFEALSRGASEVLLIEKDQRFLANIKQNYSKIARSQHGNSTTGIAHFLNADAMNAWQRWSDWHGEIDLILADPPYYSETGVAGPVEILSSVDIATWGSGAILVLESATDIFLSLPASEQLAWEKIKHKVYGRTTTVSYWRSKY
jgi:16S rRNA (guanine966-N2)-methyltransferase